MKVFVLFCLSTILNFTFLFSQATFDEVKKEKLYPFLLSVPPDSIDAKGPSPLMVFLHGRSLSGEDLNLVKKYGVLHEMDKKARFIPAYVVGPQVKKGESWNPDKILDLVNYMIHNYNVDSSRVYVAGMSLGGYGTLHFAGKYPEKVAAAVALCGGGDSRDACRLATIPLWIEHGQKDESVPVSESIKIVDAIKKCGDSRKLKFIIDPEANHGALEKIFRKDEFYSWLFSFSKNKLD
ncbi:MAG: phospholipase [Bacteroidetes bacterium]|nr:phospholipase [Bacteroidota bacterium]